MRVASPGESELSLDTVHCARCTGTCGSARVSLVLVGDGVDDARHVCSTCNTCTPQFRNESRTASAWLAMPAAPPHVAVPPVSPPPPAMRLNAP